MQGEGQENIFKGGGNAPVVLPLCVSQLIYIAQDSINTQKHETEEMHCGKTWIYSLGVTQKVHCYYCNIELTQ